LEALRRAAPARGVRLAPAECLAIEDSLQGIRAAKAAGMRCLAVAHTYPRERLGEADRAVERVGDLSAGEVLSGAGEDPSRG
ncbi:MAG: HAD-IA family hydrolase, partial [Thermoanaerobaculia bacterium]